MYKPLTAKPESIAFVSFFSLAESIRFNMDVITDSKSKFITAALNLASYEEQVCFHTFSILNDTFLQSIYLTKLRK